MAVVTTVTFNYILVIVCLSALNLGVNPCFHCTVLVPVYRVFTSCFHNIVVSSCYRLHISCLPHGGLLVSVWTCGFSLSWNVSLIKIWWESAHIHFNLWFMVSLLYVLIWWNLVPTSQWGKLNPVPTAVLIVTMISITTQSVLKTHSFYRY